MNVDIYISLRLVVKIPLPLVLLVVRKLNKKEHGEEIYKRARATGKKSLGKQKRRSIEGH